MDEELQEKKNKNGLAESLAKAFQGLSKALDRRKAAHKQHSVWKRMINQDVTGPQDKNYEAHHENEHHHVRSFDEMEDISLIEKPKEQEEKGVAQELAEQLSEMIQGAAEKLAQKVDDRHADKKMTDEEKNYRRNAQQVVENKAKNVNEDLQALKGLVNRNSLLEKPKEQEEKGVAQELAEQLSEMIQGAAE